MKITLKALILMFAKAISFMILAFSLLFALSACSWFGSDDPNSGNNVGKYKIYYYNELNDTEKTLEVTQGSSYSLSPVPTHAGYKFLGLYDEKGTQYMDENGQSRLPYSDGRDISLTIKWERFVVTIKFNIAGATLQNTLDMEDRYFDYNGNITSVPTPMRTGWYFLGWYSGTNSSAVRYSNSMGILPDKVELTVQNYPALQNGKELTFYAQFERITYDVTIYRDGSEGDVLEIVKVPHGEKVDNYIKHLPTSERISKGNAKRLLYYSNVPNQGAGKFTGAVESNMNLYGQWETLTTADGYDDYIVARIDFERIALDKSGKYLLLNDLNLGTWNAPFDFSGTFDGGGNILSYTQTINGYSGAFYGGLFSKLETAIIRNLKLKVNINKERHNDSYVGGLAGKANGNTLISKVSVEGSIWIKWDGDSSVGGIIGLLQGGRIDQCKNNASISTIQFWTTVAGGIVGTANPVDSIITISNCYNQGQILADSGGVGAGQGRAAGGIVGVYKTVSGKSANIENCYNDSTVEAKGGWGAGWWSTGALVGDVSGNNYIGLNISYCYWNSNLCSMVLHNRTSFSGTTGKINMTGFDYQGGTWRNETIWTLNSGAPKLTWELN